MGFVRESPKREPQIVIESWPEIGHRLYLRVVMFCTSFPIWKPKIAPTRMSVSKSFGSRRVQPLSEPLTIDEGRIL